MNKLPSFIIIGAMKSATSTLYQQLKTQNGIFLPEIKEPNFYSANADSNQDLDWYMRLFDSAREDDLIGEASTHYTKLPTFPHVAKKISIHNPNVKLIYIIRNPIDRLISHYIHEWTENNIKVDINEAIHVHPELVKYSLYHYQIKPYLDCFERQNMLIVSFNSLIMNSQQTLQHICNFIGYKQQPIWIKSSNKINQSTERIRKFPMYHYIVESELASWFRVTFIPKQIRNNIKRRYQMTSKPHLNEANIDFLKGIFDEDLAQLAATFSVADLNCDNFDQHASKIMR